jgi:hypothetical protein
MAELQPKHVAYKLTIEFYLIVDIICCVLDGNNKYHYIISVCLCCLGN